MKAPSKNVSASLRGQKPGSKGPEPVVVSAMSGKLASMTVPGEGSVETPPGMRHERSAANYADPMNRVK